MASNKKPKKKYKPRYVITPKNMMAYVKESVSGLAVDQLNDIHKHLSQAVDRLIAYVAPADGVEGSPGGPAGHCVDWDSVRTALLISQSIEDSGIVKGLREEIVATDQVLCDIYDDSSISGETEDRWEPATVSELQRDQLFFFKKFFRHQISSLTVREYSDIIDRMERQNAARVRVAT